MTDRSAQVVVVADEETAASPLGPGHDLPTIVCNDATAALSRVAELRLRAVPVVLLLGRRDLNIPAIVVETSRRHPEVPVVVATFNGSPHERSARTIAYPAGSEALTAATRQALRSASQHVRVRTTLDRLNTRLRVAALEAQTSQDRRLFLSGLYLASFIEHARDGMFVTDRSGIVALWNAAATRLFGCADVEIVGRRLDESTGSIGRTLQQMVEYLNDEHPTISRSLTIELADATHDLEVSLSIVRAPSGEGIAVSGIARDVTEREVLLRELKHRASELEESNRLKEEFLAILSHELRTPLNAVLGWAHMLLEFPVDRDRVTRAAHTIVRNAEVQRRLVEDLLDYARIAAGRLPLRREHADVGTVARTAADAHRPTLEAKGLELKEQYDDDVHAFIDQERLGQVVGNLLGNAVKFTDPGGRIEIRVTRGSAGISIRVLDTGRGIAPDFLPHVFEHFRQGEPSTSRQEGGLGLGLAISQRIVELHGGTIAADSEGIGRGATFEVFIPTVPSHRGSPSRE